ncbi:MAG: hypothetical protein LYZ66_02055 [Nitrososphaerales archaeon]|nr:hypothetical protein [Nitrososphaerales archaeon]
MTSSSSAAAMPKRKMLLTTRQISVAAVLGGLSLITEAFGLSLPGYLPGVNFNLVGAYLSIATMAAGPLGGIIVTILDSFTSSVGFYGLPFYWPHIFVLAVFYKRIYAMNSTAAKVVSYWAVTAVALFIQYWGWFFLYVYVFKFAPTIWPLAVYNFVGVIPYATFLAIYALVPAVLLVSTPNFVKPTWNFPYLRWITILSVVLTAIAVATQAGL